jgi:hypothetical protein
MSGTPNLSCAEWIRSSYSGGNGGQCVEFSRTFFISPGIVPVRDSKYPDAALTFSVREWGVFIEAVKIGNIGI